jgi:hypothetical protein
MRASRSSSWAPRQVGPGTKPSCSAPPARPGRSRRGPGRGRGSAGGRWLSRKRVTTQVLRRHLRALVLAQGAKHAAHGDAARALERRPCGAPARRGGGLLGLVGLARPTLRRAGAPLDALRRRWRAFGRGGLVGGPAGGDMRGRSCRAARARSPRATRGTPAAARARRRLRPSSSLDAPEVRVSVAVSSSKSSATTPDGTRNPVRYQCVGDTSSTSRASPCRAGRAGSGPTRSRRSAWINRSRTGAACIAADGTENPHTGDSSLCAPARGCDNADTTRPLPPPRSMGARSRGDAAAAPSTPPRSTMMRAPDPFRRAPEPFRHPNMTMWRRRETMRRRRETMRRQRRPRETAHEGLPPRVKRPAPPAGGLYGRASVPDLGPPRPGAAAGGLREAVRMPSR